MSLLTFSCIVTIKQLYILLIFPQPKLYIFFFITSVNKLCCIISYLFICCHIIFFFIVLKSIVFTEYIPIFHMHDFSESLYNCT